MGSTSTHKPRGQHIRDFIAERIGSDCEIVEAVAKRNPRHFRGAGDWMYHLYAAVRFREGHPEAGRTWGLVVLYSAAPRSYYNLSYKLVTEDEGPNAAHAPATVLDALTDTHSEYAMEWRRACRANLERGAVR